MKQGRRKFEINRAKRLFLNLAGELFNNSVYARKGLGRMTGHNFAVVVLKENKGFDFLPV